MRQFRSLMLAASVAGALLGAAAPGQAADKTMILSTVNAVGTMVNKMGAVLEKDVESANAGLQVNHVEGTVLGSAPQVMDQLAKGSIQLMGNDLTWVAPFSKDLSVLNWSFAFRDVEHMQRFFDSELFQSIVEDIAKKNNVRVLAAAPGQARYLYTRVPVNSAGDLKGLKIRVPQVRTFMESWSAFGATPTPLNFGEVFLAIKTGVIDGAFGAPSDTFGNNFHVSGNNVAPLGDTFSSYGVFVNEKFFQALTSEQQKILTEKAKASVRWANTEATKEMNKLLDEMKGAGAKFTTLDTGPLRAAALVKGQKMESEGEWASGLLNKIQEIR